jgi:hypothetical protein
MKMKVQWLCNLGTYRAGEQIELPMVTARALIAAGMAQEVAAAPRDEPAKRRYRRRDLTAEGE